MLACDLVCNVLAVRAEGLVLTRADGDHDAGPVARADDHVFGLRRAVHEVPLAQGPLLALDDQERLARDDEERLGLGLPVVQRVRLAGLEHRELDAEHREECVGLPLGLARERHRLSTLARPPAGVACVHDEPAASARHETVLGSFERSLRDH